AAGDRVAVALFNSFEWFEVLNALGRLGALLVPVSFRGKGPEIAYMLADSAAKLLIVDPRLAAEVDRALAEQPLRDDAVWVTGPGSQGQLHLTIGATIVIMPRFDAEDLLRLVERHRVTNAQMVPAMFFRVLALPEEVRRRYDLSSLRKVLHAAAPCPVAVKQR